MMKSPYRLTKLIMMWLDNNCPWIHYTYTIPYFNEDDIIHIQGCDDIVVFDNKWVMIRPSNGDRNPAYVVDIRDPDFFSKIEKHLGL